MGAMNDRVARSFLYHRSIAGMARSYTGFSVRRGGSGTAQAMAKAVAARIIPF